MKYQIIAEDHIVLFEQTLSKEGWKPLFPHTVTLVGGTGSNAVIMYTQQWVKEDNG